MISFIIPFSANDGQLEYWPKTDTPRIILTTINCIRNINDVFDQEKEIILVDNTHNFPDIKMPNLRIIKGWQALSEEELKQQKDYSKYNIDNLKNQTMWASMAYNIGIQEAKGDYIILQHNDIVYHNNLLDKLHKALDRGYAYVSVDSKKIGLSAYVVNKETIDNIIPDVLISGGEGGYVKSTKVGVADAYFFFCKKEFFDDYYVDWAYNDTNHGATIKCLQERKRYLHIGPYYDNPNFSTVGDKRTYKYRGEKFLTHLKGGFSEGKLSYKVHEELIDFEDTYNTYIKDLNDEIRLRREN